MKMSEDEENMREAIARAKLNAEVTLFSDELRELIEYQVNNQISVNEVIDGFTVPKTGYHTSAEDITKLIVLGWVRRLLFEIYAESFGEKQVAKEFDNTYYQISGQHIGPEDFSEKAKPYGK